MLKAASGGGVDYAFEVIGLPETTLQAYNMIRKGGTAVMVGMTRAQMAEPHLVRKIELGVEHISAYALTVEPAISKSSEMCSTGSAGSPTTCGGPGIRKRARSFAGSIIRFGASLHIILCACCTWSHNII